MWKKISICAVGYLKGFLCVQCVTEFVKLYLNHLLIASHFSITNTYHCSMLWPLLLFYLVHVNAKYSYKQNS